MRYLNWDITFQEVPNEISLSFSITGCPIRCLGCHSPELWSSRNGKELTFEKLQELINRYRGQITAVLFLGGEWHEEELISFLQLAKSHSLKTCLYTGKETASEAILSHLDFLKTGSWISEKGGLDSETTNQKFIDVKNNQILNHLFHK